MSPLVNKIHNGRAAQQQCFDGFADAVIGAVESLELKLAQCELELELAKSNASDLGRQLNEERAFSASRYWAGVEDCRAIVSGGVVRDLNPAARVELMDRMAALPDGKPARPHRLPPPLK